MIKNVLVAIDGSEHARSAIEHALWLAQKFSATVTAHHVIDIVSIEGSFLHDISGSLGFEPYLDFSSRMREILEERGRVMFEEFQAECRERGIRCDTQMDMGVIANEICDRARTADVVVIGRRGVNERFSSGMLGSTAESVTRKCTKPLLVCPRQWNGLSHPLLAYDGSSRSAAAMHAAAEFCVTTKLPLTVIHANRDSGTGEKILAEAERYLAPYEIDTRYRPLTEDRPESIVGALEEGPHDLLFVGAYGHSRIVEMVIGSTTEYVLRNTPCPVFLHR